MQLPQSLSRLASLGESARSDRWIKSLPLWVSVALVLLLAWQLVQLAWVLLGARQPAAGDPAGGSTVAVPAGPRVDVAGIVNAHLFGVAGAGPSETDPNAVAATQMNLVLVGTIAQADPELGYAIIGESAQSAKVYAVGKTVTGGTKLHSVYPDRVILDRGGKLEALLLPKKFQGGGPPPPAAMAAATGDPMLGDRLRQLAAENPGAITEVIRPQPVFANGQQRGYRVYPGRNRAQFTKLGLMPGDLVTAINGAPLDDPARGMEILQSMNAASEVTVTVERNGQPTQININNAQVAADAAAAAAMPDEAIPVSEIPASSGGQDTAE
ncbi:MAG: type II secretion system protein GspC [Steroidobacteraceae bacterium]